MTEEVNKLEKRYCTVCFDEVLIQYITPEKTYRIDDNGEVVREDNNISDAPYIEVRCAANKYHEIGVSPALITWVEEAEKIIKKKVMEAT